MKELNFHMLTSKEDYELLLAVRKLSLESEALKLAERKAGYGQPLVSIAVKGDFEDEYVFENEKEIQDFWEKHFFGRPEYLGTSTRDMLDYFVSKFRTGFTGIVLVEYVG